MANYTRVPYDEDYPPHEDHKKKVGAKAPITYTYTNDHAPKYKYNEDKILAEIKAYVDKTYGQHYSRNKFQATEFIIDSGHGTGFCVGNVLKYAQRYGKKGDKDAARQDMLKVIHYAMMQLYIHDMESDNEAN